MDLISNLIPQRVATHLVPLASCREIDVVAVQHVPVRAHRDVCGSSHACFESHLVVLSSALCNLRSQVNQATTDGHTHTHTLPLIDFCYHTPAQPDSITRLQCCCGYNRETGHRLATRISIAKAASSAALCSACLLENLSSKCNFIAFITLFRSFSLRGSGCCEHLQLEGCV